jgi:hypothetical protein
MSGASDLSKAITDTYKNVYAPDISQLSSMLSSDLNAPLDPNEQQRIKTQTADQFKPAYKKTSERLASTGMLNSGVSQRFFTDIDTAESTAINNALMDWQNTKKQDAIKNMQSFLGGSNQAASNAVAVQPDYSWLSGLGSTISDILYPSSNTNSTANTAKLLQALGIH